LADLFGVSLPTPPPIVVYVGALGGLAGFVSLIINLAAMWRNRRRIELRVITAEHYFEPVSQHDIDEAKAAGYLVGRPGPVSDHAKKGSAKRLICVLEFAIRNEHPTELTVGRIRINGWMYSDHYVPDMYDYYQRRDYRVFDLATRERTGLDVFKKVGPK